MRERRETREHDARERPDAAGLRSELVRRGVPLEAAGPLVAALAGQPHMLRLPYVMPVLAVLSDVGATTAEVADDAARMLRAHGYLPEPTRCRWHQGPSREGLQGSRRDQELLRSCEGC